jgi:DNA-directed RNA polymerase specialized sigma24 family protein
MALDQATAQRLWNSRYAKELQDYAFKNKYLNEFQDVSDMFQDMYLGVWKKSIDSFDETKTNFAGGNVERAFNAFFHQILNQFLANQAAHKDTGKQKWIQDQKSLNAPASSSEDEGSRTLMDLVEHVQGNDHETEMDLDRLMKGLPKNLSEPLQFIIENAGRGNINEVMDQVRQQWGWTKTRLFNELIKYPIFTEFATNY